MSNLETTADQGHPRADVRAPWASAVPPTPGELAASQARWDRRGLLQRLVRAN